MKSKIFRGVLCVSLLVLSGCQAINAVLPVVPAAPTGTILLFDDFSSNANHWSTSSGQSGAISFIYQGLDMKVNQPNAMIWSVVGRKYQDVQIDVDNVLFSGPNNDAFGVICRYQDSKHFYGFLLSHDGYFGIFKMQNGLLSLADTDSGMKYSATLRQGGTVNHIQAVCQGDILKLSVNGNLLAMMSDNSFNEGQVGLIAGTYATAGAEQFFDNFQVTQP